VATSAPIHDDWRASARTHQQCSVQVVQQAPSAAPGARRTLQRVARCAPDLQRELGLTVRQFPLKERSACRAMPSRATSLRGAFVAFFANTNVSREQCLSAGATRRTAYRLRLSPNVRLVFKRIPNVVKCSQQLLLLMLLTLFRGQNRPFCPKLV
jgi:hypothetical protein